MKNKNVEIKVGSIVKFANCTCGEASLTDGNTYEVLQVKFPLFSFLDDKGVKRIRNITTRCFSVEKF